MGHYTDLLVLRRGRQLNLNLSSAQLHLAVWPGGSYLPSLSLCFPFCKMGIMTAAASLGSWLPLGMGLVYASAEGDT